MLSEWLVEVPENFEEDWLMVACPWGKRCLVVAAYGTTTAYGRNGYRVNSFPSHLPGGNRQQKDKYRDNAILDCIYHEVEKTFYVLDIMNWKNHPVYDSDTDFRFFWMLSKLQEVPEAGEVSKINPYKFIPLQYHACKKDTLQNVFESATQQFDGCLFYHRQAHYTFGRSPLVIWLKPYMVPEMLGIPVPDSMTTEKPANYTTYEQHLTQVKETRERQEREQEKKQTQKKSRRGPNRSSQFKMDLMQSSWFREIPPRFDTDWVLLTCPVGQRCLVMAIDGETKWFNKMGHKLPGYFLSVLPGGNGTEYGYGPTVVTLLDCVYVEDKKTYFILDAIRWGDYDLTQIPYDERMKWVRQQFMKLPELKFVTELNMFKFAMLYHFDCTLDGLGKAIWQTTFEIDGLLFYKRDTPYLTGETQEVLWMKPYMLPEVFDGVVVPHALTAKKPASYSDFTTFLHQLDSGLIKPQKNNFFKKKTGNSKAFVPKVELKLPPPLPKVEKQEKKKITKGPGKNGPQPQKGQSGNHGNPKIVQQNYQGFDQSGPKRPFGRGSLSGHSYFGDESDYYYPSDDFRYQEYRGRRDGGGDAFRMAELHAAIAYYDYDRTTQIPRARNQSYKKF
ncbi:uncharacterized protein LOC127875954 isoform X2 [Dreissena polymorpha]|nr:uncharacterized protein LOC127875954 isoform X2 [Dreissena polymorpha]